MSSALTLLARVGEAHRRMLGQAEALDWDGLSGEWDALLPKITELGQIPLDRLTGEERAQAARQIAELIELEKRISDRVTPWMEQVSPLLEVFRKYPLEGEGKGTPLEHLIQ